MDQKIGRRQFMRKAGKVGSIAVAATVMGADTLLTERRAEATGGPFNSITSVYYVGYPPFLTPRTHLQVYGSAGDDSGSTIVYPDFFRLYVQDASGNDIDGPFDFTYAQVGAYSIYTPVDALTAGSIRVWVDAFWGPSIANYTSMLSSKQVHGQDQDPTENAYIPCYSGCCP